MQFSTENILFKLRCEGLERALTNEQKHRARKKPLLLDLHTESEGGAIFFSPQKIQQARDLQLQKMRKPRKRKLVKDKKKLQHQLVKESREPEKLGRAQIRQQKREQRQQEAAEKQRLQAEQELAKQADSQLQKYILATSKPSVKQTKQISKQAKPKSSSTAHEEAVGEVIAVNRRGRQIRLPKRFR